VNGSQIEFDWDEANIGHVARHGVLLEEAEQVILNDPVDFGIVIIEGAERYLNLRCNTARPRSSRGDNMARSPARVVTAFEPIKRLIQFYYKERKK
jgi:hypothetical protein